MTRPLFEQNKSEEHTSNIRMHESWKRVLADEFEKPYWKELTSFVREEYKKGAVYPPPKHIFRALDLCPFEEVKVVILGQDPYHGRGQANGLCFAVGEGIALPPSLQNIFKEIECDLGHPAKEKSGLPVRLTPARLQSGTRSHFAGGQTGDLMRWAEQGVLLLNATLTVRASSPGSHQRKGWEEFTDAIVRALNEKRERLVFMLWGKYAQEKGSEIDFEKHLVLIAAHPSPYSASNGFFGCRHFSQANEYLKQHGKKPIDW